MYTLVPSQVNGLGVETVLINTPATVPSQLSVAVGTDAGATASAGQDTTVGLAADAGATGSSTSTTVTASPVTLTVMVPKSMLSEASMSVGSLVRSMLSVPSSITINSSVIMTVPLSNGIPYGDPSSPQT